MKFALVHKAAAYLMVLVSLCPVVIAGDISLSVLVLFLTVALPSWFVERGPEKTWVDRMWDAGIVLLFVGRVLNVVRGGAIVTDLEYLLLGFLIHRLYNRRSSRDYLWLYVLSFLLLVIGTTVSLGVSFLFLFLAYIVLLVWNLVFHHLRREMEENYLLRHADATQSERVEVARVLNSRRIIGPSFLGGTALASLGVFLGALVVFFVFPRIGFGFSLGTVHLRTTLAGFSETIHLGQHGRIKDNPEVVMRVMLPSPPKQPLRFRGAVFSFYQNGQWTHGFDTRFAMSESTHPGGRATTFAMPSPPYVQVPLSTQMAGALHYEVFLEPLNSAIMFAADRPVAFDIPTPLGSGFRLSMNHDMEVRADRLRNSTLQYQAYSDLELAPEPLLAQAAVPDEFPELYLHLPTSLPQEVIQLAQQITAPVQGQGSYAHVTAVRDYLVSHYRYTLDLKRNPSLEPIYEFLFVRREGHCEYFASAMALLLRAVHIPTRVVNGFLGGAWNDVGNFLAVRQGDAHSWVEVYFPRVGWVAFDPTPPAGQVSQAAVSWARMVLDATRLAWTRWIMEYDLTKQVEAVKGAARWLGGKPLAPGFAGAREAALRLVRPLLFAIVGLLFLWLLLWLRPWRRLRFGKRACHAGAPQDAATLLYRKLLRQLEREGLVKPSSQTAEEFVAVLRQTQHRASCLAGRIARLYYDVRFGGMATEPQLLASLNREIASLRS